MKLEPGDIVLIHNRGFSWLRLITGLYWNHVLLVDEPSNGDYGIIESIAKGIALGFLSFYKNCEILVLRYRDITTTQQQQLRHAARHFGRCHYDFWLPFRVIKKVGFIGTIRLVIKLWNKQYPIPIPHDSESYLVCSELVQEVYSAVGLPLTSNNFTLTPDEIETCEDKLVKMWRGQIEDLPTC